MKTYLGLVMFGLGIAWTAGSMARDFGIAAILFSSCVMTAGARLLTDEREKR